MNPEQNIIRHEEDGSETAMTLVEKDYLANIDRLANQRDDAVNSYLNCRQDLEYCKHHAHQSAAYICGTVEKELMSESSRMSADKATEAMNNAAGAAMCVRRLRDSTPEGWPGGRIHWTHTEEDSENDLPRIEAWPEHRTRPHFTAQMRKPHGQDLPSVDVIMTHSEPDIDDLEYCIAEFSVAFRDDLPECSRCSGTMRCYGIGCSYDCPWCDGRGVSVMDEAMKMAAWIYNSWLTTRSLGKDSTRLTDDPVNSGSCNDGDLAPKRERS